MLRSAKGRPLMPSITFSFSLARRQTAALMFGAVMLGFAAAAHTLADEPTPDELLRQVQDLRAQGEQLKAQRGHPPYPAPHVDLFVGNVPHDAHPPSPPPAHSR